ncbi:MAG: Na/Pi cotransporter family protein, partial [Planctomycetes bacterium]|nr:Na/Pi cotransporter family protein [Planctomycetota bacterium]
MEFLKHYTGMGFYSFVLFIIVGVVLTIVVQSSSAAGAITVTMAYKGWIDFPTAAAIVLGENIGTTITAYLAALAGNINAKRAARAHLVFNVIGVIWMVVLFHPFITMIESIIPGSTSDPANIPIHLSAFHTLFNLCNIVILIGFVHQISKLVERLVKPKPDDVDDEYKLEYISTGIRRTP